MLSTNLVGSIFKVAAARSRYLELCRAIVLQMSVPQRVPFYLASYRMLLYNIVFAFFQPDGLKPTSAMNTGVASSATPTYVPYFICAH